MNLNSKIMGNIPAESDLESMYLSNFDQEVIYPHKGVNNQKLFKMFSHGGMTSGGEGGGITAFDESATDNDNEF